MVLIANAASLGACVHVSGKPLIRRPIWLDSKRAATIMLMKKIKEKKQHETLCTAQDKTALYRF